MLFASNLLVYMYLVTMGPVNIFIVRQSYNCVIS